MNERKNYSSIWDMSWANSCPYFDRMGKASLFYKSGNVIDSKDVKTVEECRNWATDKARGMSMKDDAWDYSCGKGCTFNDDKISGGKEIHTYNCAEMSK
jgi:sulfatase maturation enzyme AslB (radical SAM superfamily)